MKKIWKQSLALLLAVLMLVTVAPLSFADGASYVCEKCNAERTDKDGTLVVLTGPQEATCSSFGYRVYDAYFSGCYGFACAVCGKVLSGTDYFELIASDVNETGRKLPHTSATEIQGSEPTASQHGMKDHFECTVCGSYYLVKNSQQITVTEEELIVHYFSDWTEKTPASCGVAGEETRACQIEGCTVKETRPSAALEHDWKEYEITEDAHIATPATCTVEGVYYKKCDNCGKYADEVEGAAENTFSGGDPAGHDNPDTLEWVVINPETEAVIENAKPNCLTGFTHAKFCSKCNTIIVKETIDAGTAHQWSEIEDAAAATCTEDGLEKAYMYCTVCGDEPWGAKKVIPSLGGHDYKPVAKKDATCTEDGNKSYAICSVCKMIVVNGSELPEEEGLAAVKIPALGHDLEEVAAVQPENGQPGVKAHFTCKRDCCKDKKFVLKVDEDGNMVPDEAGNPIYLEVTDAQLVLNCDHDFTKLEEGKIEIDAKKSKPATCTEAGKEVRVCKVCGAEQETDLPALGHATKDVEYIKEVEAKCNTEGYWYKICPVCGEKVDEVWPAATGKHNWETKDEYDCTKNTKVTEICTICNTSRVTNKPASPNGKHLDEDDNGVCERCEKQFCTCLCHNQTWYGKIIYFFVRVWWEFLSMRDTCDCGKIHYEKNVVVPQA